MSPSAGELCVHARNTNTSIYMYFKTVKFPRSRRRACIGSLFVHGRYIPRKLNTTHSYHSAVLERRQGSLLFCSWSKSYFSTSDILNYCALHRQIALVRDTNRRKNALADRLVEVISDKQMGETICDEALK